MKIRNYNKLMKYRQLGSRGPIVSILGFGGARLTNSKESRRAIVEAISHGINLFETGPGYGDSEIIIGDIIKDNRDKVYISTKCRAINEDGIPISQDELFQNVETSLKRLKVDKIDIFNIWNINIEQFKVARRKFGFIDGIRKLIKQKTIDHFGFSSHDSPENIKKYIDSGEFELAILSYSIIDTIYEDVINYTNMKGLGIVAMKPLYGGVVSLLSNIFDDDNQEIMGLKFVLSLPTISSAISGMTNINEVKNNIKSVSDIENIGYIFRNDIIKRYKNFYLSNMKPCSGCRYCDSCPVKIPIPKLMKLYNIINIFKYREKEYRQFIDTQTVELDDLNKCIECMSCEKKCTENLNIVERLKELHRISSGQIHRL